MADVNQGAEQEKKRQRAKLRKPRPEPDQPREGRDGRLRRMAKGTRAMGSRFMDWARSPQGKKTLGAVMIVSGVAIATVLAATGLAPAAGAALVVTGVLTYIQGHRDQKMADRREQRMPQMAQPWQSAQMGHGQHWAPSAAPGMDPRSQNMGMAAGMGMGPGMQQPMVQQHMAPPQQSAQQERAEGQELQELQKWLQDQPLSVHVQLLQQAAAEQARQQQRQSSATPPPAYSAPQSPGAPNGYAPPPYAPPANAPQAAYQQQAAAHWQQPHDSQSPVYNVGQYNPRGAPHHQPHSPSPSTYAPSTYAPSTRPSTPQQSRRSSRSM